MKIKFLITLNLLLLSTVAGCAAPSLQTTFKVTDENGASLAKAPIHIVLFDHQAPDAGFGTPIYKESTSLTDTQGVVVVNNSSPDNQVSYEVKDLPGYYQGGGLYSFKTASLVRWEPWNPTINLVLRPIIKPVPMYAKMPENLVLPEVEKPTGYDLVVGDWVAPYGKGLKSDFIFRLNRKPDSTVKVGYYQREVKLYDATLTMSFSDANDGIQTISTNDVFIGSQFKFPRYAPEDGYEPKLTRHTYRTSGDKPIKTDVKDGEAFFYRVRTVKQDGKIVSALYGKISGVDFDVINSKTAIITFTYYLNPEPNSRNMEFDPKRNLFRNLKQFEQVSAP